MSEEKISHVELKDLKEDKESPLSSDIKKRWYILQVTSGFEKKVKKAIEELIVFEELQDFFGDVLVPTEEITEIKNDKKVKTERKLYPGYILLLCEINDHIWHVLTKLPKVAGFVGGSSGKPTPISDKEAQKILDQMEVSADKPKPKILFEPGEALHIIEGPFKDFNGSVTEVNYEKSRLRVAVLIFGRSTPVELEFGQVEKM